MSKSDTPPRIVVAPLDEPTLLVRSRRWLLSPRHFHYKLLAGTCAAIAVIILLAGIFLFTTLRNHHREMARARTVQVMRLSSSIENNIANLEKLYRGRLLSGDSSNEGVFWQQRDEMKKQMDELAGLLSDAPMERKGVMRAQDSVQRWIDQVALPSFAQRGGTPRALDLRGGDLNQAREVLQSLQDEEQIFLNQRMREQEWAAQSAQILDYLPKLNRAVIETAKEKRGYLLTGENSYLDSYRRALGEFYTYHGYLSILMANSPDQAELLSDVRASVERWVNLSTAPEVEARKSGRPVNGAASVKQSEALLREVQEKIDAIQTKELARYRERSSRAAHNRILNTIGLVALALLAVGLLVSSNTYSFVLVRRQLAKLSDAEVRIRAIIESILDGMITVDGNGTIRTMNRAAEKMFGCMKDEMIGHRITRLIPSSYSLDSKPTPIEWPDLAKHTGTTTLSIGRTLRKFEFPVEISLSEMVIDRAKLYVAMVRDVTERKRFEKQIAAEKESLAVTLRSIGDGVITTDLQGRIIMINHAAELLTGWTSRDAAGQPLKKVFNIAIDLATQARAQRDGSHNEAQSILDSLPNSATLIARDGAERSIEQVASPIRDNKNEVGGVVLAFRDITERQRSEAQRRKAESLEQLGLLAGGIAHDFNNLLTAIIGNISLASILLPPHAQMTARLEDAKNASMRARDLAQQLLTFARGGAPIKKTASIGRLVQDTVSFSLRGSHNRSDFKLGKDLWRAEIDTGQISQVIANLVVNADQAMPSGGTLHVTAENYQHPGQDGATLPDLPAGDYVRIAIRDEGIGIPEQYLERIFDPYFTTKPKGNGLGLASTYSIIRNHKGLITVESEVNAGSTFTIYLPALGHAAAPEETRKLDGTPVHGTGRVLVVDDEEAICALVEFTLTQLGYQVMTAGSALAGVDLYQQRLSAGERFDLVILDLTLPGGMGGKEALKCLLEIDPTVAAIVSSGYATDATMSKYQEFGFRGVIAKPYEAAELGRIVHDTIEADRGKIGTGHVLEAVS